MSFGKRWHNLNPYDLHKTLINEYILTAKDKAKLLKRDTSKDKRDIDVIKENHQFLWESDDEDQNLSWEKRLAKKYYDKLYKEYCIGDLSRYKENKVGLRWRTQPELIDGKGQFTCGSKRCSEKNDLKTWEVNFGYVEQGVKKNALVKLRLCKDCSYKLNYHHKKKEVKRLKKGKYHSKPKSSTQPEIKADATSTPADNNLGNDPEPNHSESTERESSESNIWKETCSQEKEDKDERTREEEFEDYLDQLFL